MSYVMRLKTKLILKGKFHVHIMYQIWGIEQSDHCRLTAEKKQYWDLKLKQQVPEPKFPIVYEVNIVNAEIVQDLELKDQLCHYSQAVSDQD